ncbi:hypothetical protein HBB16_01845 [Pseudonocardia sp. MCCB 268]|nr:hypothetical protein [Pseudonocardia cytotoxica]
MRSHRSDLNISATPLAFLTALRAELETRAVRTRPPTRGSGPCRGQPRRGRHAADPGARGIGSADHQGLIIRRSSRAARRRGPGLQRVRRARSCSTDRARHLPLSVGGRLYPAAARRSTRTDRTVVATRDGAHRSRTRQRLPSRGRENGLPVLTVIANKFGGWWAVTRRRTSVYPNGTAMTSAEERFSDLVAPAGSRVVLGTASGGLRRDGPPPP